MNRRQAAQLLGIAENATAIDANQAFLGKLKELDERIQTAPSDALRQKYQDMRGELLAALQVLSSAAAQALAQTADADLDDLPGAAPTAAGNVAAAVVTQKPVRREAETSSASTEAPPDRTRLWVGLAAVAAVVLLVLGFNGTLGDAWEAVRPMSDAERLTAFKQASSLEAEIKVYQQRLEETKRGAESAVRDAANDVRRFEGELRSARSADERRIAQSRLNAALDMQGQAERIEHLQSEQVFNGKELVELQGALAAGVKLIERKGDENSQAIELLKPVRAGYNRLIKRVGSLTERANAEGETLAVLSSWETWSAGKPLETEQSRVNTLRLGLADLSAKSIDQEAIEGYKQLADSVQEIRDAAQWHLTNDAQAAAAVAAAEQAKRNAEVAQRNADANQARLAHSVQQALPVMVDIPGGTFQMGCGSGSACKDDAKPAHQVSVKRFRLARDETNISQFLAFSEATGYRTDAEQNAGGEPGCYAINPDGGKWSYTSGRSWKSPGFPQGDDHPVVCLSINDVEAYLAWLNKHSGLRFRLPTEAEFEYVLRSGSTTEYPWGNDPNAGCRYTNGADQTPFPDGSVWTEKMDCNDGYLYTAPASAYGANSFGLRNVSGNVREWTQDCWNESYSGAPTDGSAWLRGNCGRRVLRGGSWGDIPARLASAYRDGNGAANRKFDSGFRLAQDAP